MSKAPEPPGANGSNKAADELTRQAAELLEGRDYYLEHGLLVFTADFLKRRGFCCESGCRHCPYQDHEA